MIKLISEILPHKKQLMYVSVSMGVDSLAAFFYLEKMGYNVVPIHFNHAMRPQNNLMHSKFRELFPCNPIPWTNHIGVGYNLKTESDCRKARLEYYKEITAPQTETGKIYSGDTIITAHHLDDYVESYLMNCFRGKPNHKPISLITNFNTFKIVHPFLLTEKKDFIKFIQNWRGGYLKKWVVEDETNTVIKGSRRNWVRNVIIPEMTRQEISLKKFCREQIIKDVESIDCETI